MHESVQQADESPPALHVAFRVLLWVLWAALLMAPVFFTGVIGLVLADAPSQPPPDPHGTMILNVVGMIFPVVSVGLTQGLRWLVLRWVVRRRKRTGLVVGYLVGKIVAWSAIEGAVYFNLVLCLLARSFWPSVLTAFVVWLILLIDMPLLRPFRQWKGHGAAGRAGS